MSLIKLQSSDGVVVEVDRQVAECCLTIKNLLDVMVDFDPATTVIPLPNVRANILHMVLEFTEHHKNDPIWSEKYDPLRRRDWWSFYLKQWDLDFFKVELPVAMDLLMAANYLNNPALLSLGTKMVANLFQGKTPEQLIRTFSITSD